MTNLKKKKNEKRKITVGWREWIGLPDLGVKKIKVKIDTGAKTSALHVSHVRVFTERGIKKVYYRIHPNQNDVHPTIECVSRMVEKREVKSSTGSKTIRPVIRTTVQLGKESWRAEVTLVNRDVMGFRMLLGREAMRHRVLVDSGKSYMLKKIAPKKTSKALHKAK